MGFHGSKTYRRITIVIAIATALYVLMGMALMWQAVAQPFESIITTGLVHRVPTGSDDASVRAYYEYLAESELLSRHETYILNLSTLGWTYGIIGAWLVFIFFFAYAWYARHVHGDLYPIESYNGYITERGGPVDPFNWAVYTIVGSFMLYYMVVQIIYGQLY